MMVSDNKLVVVTGTPGTGKSTISEKLCKKFHCQSYFHIFCLTKLIFCLYVLIIIGV